MFFFVGAWGWGKKELGWIISWLCYLIILLCRNLVEECDFKVLKFNTLEKQTNKQDRLIIPRKN